ncbi:MAG: choice-of-anchor tandem repeat NxxGxxAF-containing protein [Planctomycetota bacterium]
MSRRTAVVVRVLVIVPAMLAGAASGASARTVLTPVALVGEAAAGATGAEYDRLLEPVINATGDVAFRADLGNAGLGTLAVVGPSAGVNSPVGVLARRLEPVPGATGDVTYGIFSKPALSDAGDVAFESSTFGGRRVLVGPTDGPGSPLGVIAQAGGPVSGSTADGTFDPNLAIGAPSINAAADVAFIASINLPDPASPAAVTAIVGPTAGAGSPRGLLWTSGQPAPGAAAGATFADFSQLGLVNVPDLNNEGDIAFLAQVQPADPTQDDYSTVFGPTQDDYWAVFGPTAGAGSPVGQLVSGIDSFPLAGGTLSDLSFRGPSLNDAGHVAFLGTGPFRRPDGSSEEATAVFAPTGDGYGGLGVIAMTGDPIPGSPEGLRLRNLLPPHLNNHGDLVFLASLRDADNDPIDADRDTALMGYVDGELQILLREGDTAGIVTPDGQLDAKVVDEFFVDRPQVFSQRFDAPAQISDIGTVAVSLIFADGAGGVFTLPATPIPEPATGVVLLFTAAVFVTRRRP